MKRLMTQGLVILAAVGGMGATPASKPIVRSEIEVCFSPDEQCDQKLVDLMGDAQATLDVAIYSITLDNIASAIKAARSRGVKVRVVVDRLQAAGRSSLVENLRKAHVPLRIGNVHGIMHNKFTIVDGERLETGSYNYTENATEENAENQIYLTDAATIRKYSTAFEQLWREGLKN